MVWSGSEFEESMIIILTQTTSCSLLLQTYMCAAELVTWGVGPDVTKREKMDNKVKHMEYMRVQINDVILNPLPTNDALVASWTLHKPIGIYMGDLVLGVILQYMVSASFSSFLWLVKG